MISIAIAIPIAAPEAVAKGQLQPESEQNNQQKCRRASRGGATRSKQVAKRHFDHTEPYRVRSHPSCAATDYDKQSLNDQRRKQ
jgi:hypothetical protein